MDFPSEILYTPESRLRKPLQLLRGLWKDIRSGRELAWRLASRDISSQYRRSFIGISWALFSPLATTLSFTLLQRQRIISVSTTELGIPYPVYVMLGTILWGLFTETFNSSLSVGNQYASLLTKVYFPREALLLANILKISFSFLVKCILLLIFLFLYQVKLSWTIILVPIPILSLLALGLALGLLLMPLTWLLDDLARVVSVALGFAFYLTPVVYPPQSRGVLGFFSTYNPVSPLLITAKELATSGDLSTFSAFAVVSLIALVLLFIGLILFRLSMPILIERMSA